MIWLDTISEIASTAPEGDFVECGTHLGYSAQVLAAHCKTTLHLFDSWEGIPELTEFDGEYYKEQKWICSLEEAQANLSEFDNIKYYKGWFPDRFDEIDNPISLLHIDASLYEPTVLSLKHFWPMLIKGGYAVCNFHEGYSKGAEKAVREFFGEDKIEHHPAGIVLIKNI